MLFDSELHSNQENVPYDVCIIGAGIAGVTIAKQCAEAGLLVALVEGGNRWETSNSQEILRTSLIGFGDEYSSHFSQNEKRFLGGNSNCWHGTCAPLDPEDFEHRDRLNLPGWEISHSEYLAYLNKASEILDINPHLFSDERLLQTLETTGSRLVGVRH